MMFYLLTVLVSAIGGSGPSKKEAAADRMEKAADALLSTFGAPMPGAPGSRASRQRAAYQELLAARRAYIKERGRR